MICQSLLPFEGLMAMVDPSQEAVLAQDHICSLVELNKHLLLILHQYEYKRALETEVRHNSWIAYWVVQ